MSAMYENKNISENKIKTYLEESISGKFHFQIYQTVDSTNTRLKQAAVEGAEEWTVLLAEEQTNGRGRMNRNFFSPYGTGIYMSVLLRPDFSPEDALMITIIAAVAVTDAIKEVYGIGTEIKWVNDIYYQNKKVCGILAEAATNPNNGKLEYVVLGIGINVEVPEKGFPTELEQIAASLNESASMKEKGDIRNHLIGSVLNYINKYYETQSKEQIMDIYRNRSFLIGRQVFVVGKEAEVLKVIGISDKGELMVEDENGQQRQLSSGEVSVKERK